MTVIVHGEFPAKKSQMGHVITTPENQNKPVVQNYNTGVQRRPHENGQATPRRMPVPRARILPQRTQSVYDPASPKGRLAQLEKILQSLIERLVVIKDSRKNRLDVAENLSRTVHLLRQRMRILRRWRNGSVSYGDNDIDDFHECVTTCRSDVFSIEIECVQEDLENVDEYILILDAGSNDLRQNIDEDFQSVQKDFNKLKLTNIDGSSKGLDDIDSRLTELTEAVAFLRGKIDPNSSQGSAASPTTEERNPNERFETNPARNRVLATADRIRRMVRVFQDGDGHVDVGDALQTQLCVDNDVEVLRRQIRKVRRWQHNAQRFDQEDVDDLQLIISAIERHLRPEEEWKLVFPRKSAEGLPSKPRRRPRSVSSGVLTMSVVSLSLDTDSETPTTPETETLPSASDITDDTTESGIEETDNGEEEEEEEFSERLI